MHKMQPPRLTRCWKESTLKLLFNELHIYVPYRTPIIMKKALTLEDVNRNDYKGDLNFTPLADRCNICRKYTIFRCQRCSGVFYCSRKCQRYDWRIHQDKCTYVPFVAFMKVKVPTGEKREIKILNSSEKKEVHFDLHDYKSMMGDQDPLIDNKQEKVCEEIRRLNTTVLRPTGILQSPDKHSEACQIDLGSSLMSNFGADGDEAQIANLLELLGGQADANSIREAYHSFGRDTNRVADWYFSGCIAPLPRPVSHHSTTDEVFRLPTSTNKDTITTATSSTTVSALDKTNIAAYANESITGLGWYQDPISGEVVLRTSTPEYTDTCLQITRTENVREQPDSPIGHASISGSDSFQPVADYPQEVHYNGSPPPRSQHSPASDPPLISKASVTLFRNLWYIEGRKCLVSITQASATDFSIAIEIDPLGPPVFLDGRDAQISCDADNYPPRWPVHSLAIESSAVLGLFRIHVHMGGDMLQAGRENDRGKEILKRIRMRRCKQGDHAVITYCLVCRDEGPPYAESQEEWCLSSIGEREGVGTGYDVSQYPDLEKGEEKEDRSVTTQEGTVAADDNSFRDNALDPYYCPEDTGKSRDVTDAMRTPERSSYARPRLCREQGAYEVNIPDPGRNVTTRTTSVAEEQLYEDLSWQLMEMLGTDDIGRANHALRIFHGDMNQAADFLLSDAMPTGINSPLPALPATTFHDTRASTRPFHGLMEPLPQRTQQRPSHVLPLALPSYDSDEYGFDADEFKEETKDERK